MIVANLSEALAGKDSISLQFVLETLKRVRARQDNILREIARLDAEVIRSHQRLDAAGHIVNKLKNKDVKNAGSVPARQ